MVFNQYGEVVREMMRSPYGHIMYDSNPYLYLPVDYCGGLLETRTELVHMPRGRIYDPLIGRSCLCLSFSFLFCALIFVRFYYLFIYVLYMYIFFLFFLVSFCFFFFLFLGLSLSCLSFLPF